MSHDSKLLERPTVDAPPPAPTDEGQQRLSADIHLLGDMLGDAIRRLAGEDAFALEEEVAPPPRNCAPGRRWMRPAACATGSTNWTCPPCAR